MNTWPVLSLSVVNKLGQNGLIPPRCRFSMRRLRGGSPAWGGDRDRGWLQRPPGSLQRADPGWDPAGGRAPKSRDAQTGPAAQNAPRLQQHHHVYLPKGNTRIIFRDSSIISQIGMNRGDEGRNWRWIRCGDIWQRVLDKIMRQKLLDKRHLGGKMAAVCHNKSPK